MKKKALILLVAGLSAFTAAAQDAESRGDSMRTAYRFSEASLAYKEALNNGADSVALNKKLLQARNGGMMMNYVCQPQVLASGRFSLEDFFLQYPFENRTWYATPNVLDREGGAFAKGLRFTGEDGYVVFSAVDTSGHRSLFSTYVKNGYFEEPESLFADMTAGSDEIFPVLSADGLKLYFSSNGLYGAGGFDLYVSRRSSAGGEWGTPENLGFPFSSPADDFLYMDSDDGNYTVFASNRSCENQDEVDVFVLKREVTPIRKKVTDPSEMAKIAELLPTVEEEPETKEDMPENSETRRYVDKMEEVRALRDSINTATKELDLNQADYAVCTDEEERARILKFILDRERAIPEYQKRLETSTRQLQDIELEFLFKGVSLDPEKLLSKADAGNARQEKYLFEKMDWAVDLHLVKILPPDPVLPELEDVVIEEPELEGI